MTPTEILTAALEMVGDQLKLPEQYSWAPLATFAGAVVIGLILMLRGARWAPALAAITFLAIGGLGGKALAGAIGTPLWPTIGVTAVLGGIMGVVMFRFWQAVVLAACCVIVAFGVYYVRDLTPEVQNWLSATAEPGVVSLEAPGTVVGDTQTNAWTKLGGLWDHLKLNVPGFTKTAWMLLLSTGLAGLVFGLLLPRFSRALWVASLGTLIFGIGATALLQQYSPGTFDWLIANNFRAWGIVGAIWLVSVGLNFMACKRGGGAKKSSGADAAAEPAAA